MITFGEALDAGWNDYYNGIRINRYDFCRQPQAHEWWIQGFDAAREWEGTATDFERE